MRHGSLMYLLHDACTAVAVFVARQSVACLLKVVRLWKNHWRILRLVYLLLVNPPSLAACCQLHVVLPLASSFTSGRCILSWVSQLAQQCRCSLALYIARCIRSACLTASVLHALDSALLSCLSSCVSEHTIWCLCELIRTFRTRSSACMR